MEVYVARTRRIASRPWRDRRSRDYRSRIAPKNGVLPPRAGDYSGFQRFRVGNGDGWRWRLSGATDPFHVRRGCGRFSVRDPSRVSRACVLTPRTRDRARIAPFAGGGARRKSGPAAPAAQHSRPRWVGTLNLQASPSSVHVVRGCRPLRAYGPSATSSITTSRRRPYPVLPCIVAPCWPVIMILPLLTLVSLQSSSKLHKLCGAGTRRPVS
jgi:hypothetical protein